MALEDDFCPQCLGYWIGEPGSRKCGTCGLPEQLGKEYRARRRKMYGVEEDAELDDAGIDAGEEVAPRAKEAPKELVGAAVAEAVPAVEPNPAPPRRGRKTEE